MKTLTLNDGTVVNGHCLLQNDILFVYLDGMSIAEGVALFSDPERTEIIIENTPGNTHEHRGYMELYSADHEYGNCNLVMKKG